MQKNFKYFLQMVKENTSDTKLDEQTLAFLINYGPKYIDNDASILEFLQNTDEDNANDEYIETLKKHLQKVRNKYE
jgi:hypothetical protein